MNFVSIEFILFFSLTVLGYLSLASDLARRGFLLLASYVFYSFANWHFVFLLIFTTALNYHLALAMDQHPQRKNYFLVGSVLLNLSMLFFFKYINIFTTGPLVLFLPVGISFFTFQAMSYTFDVYNGQKKEESFLDFALYIAFFPQLVAGPIERSSHLLPQVKKLTEPNWKNITAGWQLILLGFFKKIVIADNLAIGVDRFYQNPASYSQLDAVFAIYAYAFQIYFDFSSYTDIARGLAKFFGIDLVENFRLPYLASSLTEFWNRWHLSLSSWFRDYLYYPLCFNRHRRINPWVAIIIVFVLSGLWHGAGWNFIAWGLGHGMILAIEVFWPQITPHSTLGKTGKLLSTLVTFHVVCLLWILFRASSISHAILVFNRLVDGTDGLIRHLWGNSSFIVIASILFAEGLGIKFREKTGYISIQNRPLRWTFYVAMIVAMVLFGQFGRKSYIYFQF